MNDIRRTTGWLPSSQDTLDAWLRGRIEAGRRQGPRHPTVQALADLIDDDPVLRMHANQMIEQVPGTLGPDRPHPEDLEQLLDLIDVVVHSVPEFGQDMVATPLGGVLDATTATPAGFAFYRDPRVNDALRAVLDAWSEHLSSRASLEALNDSPTGWKSDAAREAIGIDRFVYDPEREDWGFSSWNDFFTRAFRADERPVASPDDGHVVVSPCESAPYRIADRVRLRDRFWAKGEPYSVDEVLAGDEAAPRFDGGTVFQAFLSATDYHRWHAPTSGSVLRAWVVPGTYYSEADAQGPGATEPTTSQGYLAHVATRAIALIESDEPDVGLVACVFIGMSDVSSCIFDEHVRAGVHVTKGDELGRFQYGGSTVCVLFEPHVVESFALHAVPQPDDEEPSFVQVRSHLATARRRAG